MYQNISTSQFSRKFESFCKFEGVPASFGAVKALLQISEGFQFITGAEINFWVMTKYHEEYETGELMIQLWQLTVHHKNDSCNYFAALDGDPQ